MTNNTITKEDTEQLNENIHDLSMYSDVLLNLSPENNLDENTLNRLGLKLKDIAISLMYISDNIGEEKEPKLA